MFVRIGSKCLPSVNYGQKSFITIGPDRFRQPGPIPEERAERPRVDQPELQAPQRCQGPRRQSGPPGKSAGR